MASNSPTILRVKRRRNEDPAEVLLVTGSAKRAKTSSFSFALASTSESPKFNKKNWEKFRSDPKIRQNSSKSKIAASASASAASASHRYKILLSKRFLGVENRQSEIYDVIKEEEEEEENTPDDVIACNGVPASKVDSDDDYVYDFYYPKMDQFLELEKVDRIESFDPYEYRENQDSSPEEYEDEDSNDENNWRNDYPDDEEDRDFFGDFGGRLNLADAESLSDDEEDELVYSREFGDDADRHGASYARFKRRVLKDRDSDDELDDYGDNELDEYDYND